MSFAGRRKNFPGLHRWESPAIRRGLPRRLAPMTMIGTTGHNLARGERRGGAANGFEQCPALARKAGPGAGSPRESLTLTWVVRNDLLQCGLYVVDGVLGEGCGKFTVCGRRGWGQRIHSRARLLIVWPTQGGAQKWRFQAGSGSREALASLLANLCWPSRDLPFIGTGFSIFAICWKYARKSPRWS